MIRNHQICRLKLNGYKNDMIKIKGRIQDENSEFGMFLDELDYDDGSILSLNEDAVHLNIQ